MLIGDLNNYLMTLKHRNKIKKQQKASSAYMTQITNLLT